MVDIAPFAPTSKGADVSRFVASVLQEVREVWKTYLIGAALAMLFIVFIAAVASLFEVINRPPILVPIPDSGPAGSELYSSYPSTSWQEILLVLGSVLALGFGIFSLLLFFAPRLVGYTVGVIIGPLIRYNIWRAERDEERR